MKAKSATTNKKYKNQSDKNTMPPPVYNASRAPRTNHRAIPQLTARPPPPSPAPVGEQVLTPFAYPSILLQEAQRFIGTRRPIVTIITPVRRTFSLAPQKSHGSSTNCLIQGFPFIPPPLLLNTCSFDRGQQRGCDIYRIRLDLRGLLHRDRATCELLRNPRLQSRTIVVLQFDY